MPDIRKPLPVIAQEWISCEKCALGTRRRATSGSFISGEGATGGVMVIGASPGKEDEQAAGAFTSAGGQLLRSVLAHLDMGDITYLTYCTACRSCSQAIDGEGQLKFWPSGDPIMQDRDPLAEEYRECLPRLYEEIYLVDPVIIVALGAASKILVKGVANMEHKTLATVSIPGAGKRAHLTAKKKQWRRKVKGSIELPVTQNMVDYVCIKGPNPEIVEQTRADQRDVSQLNTLVEVLTQAKAVYELHNKFVVNGDRY